jgi:hypothetical protein
MTTKIELIILIASTIVILAFMYKLVNGLSPLSLSHFNSQQT